MREIPHRIPIGIPVLEEISISIYKAVKIGVLYPSHGATELPTRQTAIGKPMKSSRIYIQLQSTPLSLPFLKPPGVVLLLVSW